MQPYPGLTRSQTWGDLGKARPFWYPSLTGDKSVENRYSADYNVAWVVGLEHCAFMLSVFSKWYGGRKGGILGTTEARNEYELSPQWGL